MSQIESTNESSSHLRSNDYKIDNDDWEQIKTLPIIDLSKNSDSLNRELSYEPRITTSITLEEVLNYFEGIHINEQLARIQPICQRTGFYAMISELLCLSPAKLDQNLIDERNRIFAIALHSFDNQDLTQLRFLVTIYQKLTGSALLECRRFGNHWEDVGFQGTDPATDLRGVGLLGLLQLLFLILSPETCLLCREIYALSLDKRQHFPFAVMSTNITQIALQILREGLLNKECNQAKCVFRVFNWFYSGIFFQLFKIWKENHKTISDSGYVLRDLRKIVRRNVKQIIIEMLNYKNELQTKNQSVNEDDINFTNLGDMFADLEEYKP